MKILMPCTDYVVELPDDIKEVELEMRQSDYSYRWEYSFPQQTNKGKWMSCEWAVDVRKACFFEPWLSDEEFSQMCRERKTGNESEIFTAPIEKVKEYSYLELPSSRIYVYCFDGTELSGNELRAIALDDCKHEGMKKTCKPLEGEFFVDECGVGDFDYYFDKSAPYYPYTHKSYSYQKNIKYILVTERGGAYGLDITHTEKTLLIKGWEDDTLTPLGTHKICDCFSTAVILNEPNPAKAIKMLKEPFEYRLRGVEQRAKELRDRINLLNGSLVQHVERERGTYERD